MSKNHLKTRSNTYTPHLFVALAAILWAFDGVLRRNLFVLAPLLIVFWEHAIGAALLAPTSLQRTLKTTFTRKVVILTGIVALLSGVLGTLAFTQALVMVNFIPFSVVLLLQKLQPLFAIGSARVFLKEKMVGSYWLWALIAVVSAYFVTFPNGAQIAWESQTTTAAALAVFAAFAWGTSTTFSKQLIAETSAQTATFLRFSTTAIIALALMFITQTTLSLPSTTQFLYLIAIALSTGMVALWLYYKGLSGTKASVATIIELLFPVVAVFIDVFLYDTILEPLQLVAAAVLVGSITKLSLEQQNK